MRRRRKRTRAYSTRRYSYGRKTRRNSKKRIFKRKKYY